MPEDTTPSHGSPAQPQGTQTSEAVKTTEGNSGAAAQNAQAKAADNPPSNTPQQASASQQSSKPAAAPAKTPAPAAPAGTSGAAKPVPAPKPAIPSPQPWNADLVGRLRRQYGSGIAEASSYVGQNYLVVDSTIVYEVLRWMCEEEQFDYCVDITAVHYPKREQQFDVIYILYSFHANARIRVKTQIKDGQALRSVVKLWPTANWLEREVFDMFGIVFDEHPDLKRILLPDEWRGHPLRKDYNIRQQDSAWIHENLGIESAQ